MYLTLYKCYHICYFKPYLYTISTLNQRWNLTLKQSYIFNVASTFICKLISTLKQRWNARWVLSYLCYMYQDSWLYVIQYPLCLNCNVIQHVFKLQFSYHVKKNRDSVIYDLYQNIINYHCCIKFSKIQGFYTSVGVNYSKL